MSVEQTNETEQDYQRAARLIREKFAALGIVATFSTPAPGVTPAEKLSPGSFNKPQPWAHVAFTVMFTRPPRTAAISREYKIGTGLAPWKDPKVRSAARLTFAGPFSRNAAQYVAERECGIRGGSRYRPEIEAEAAAIACRVAKWTPNAAEIFAGICRDGRDTRDVSFEDWAPEFGYDPDSRKAEKVYNACRQCWADALRLVSAADAEEFAELAARL